MVAVRNAWGHQHTDFSERLQIAWFAIVEHIYAAEDRPEVSHLLRAATRAIHGQAHQERRFRGVRDAEGGIRAGFECFWWSCAGHTASPERSVTERIALQQIWPLLRPRYQKAFTALAVYEDYRLAADAVGKSYKAFVLEISRARRAFLALWHEGETPSRPWGNDRRRTSSTPRGSITYRTVVLRQRERARRAVANDGIAVRQRGSARTDLGLSDDELVRRYREGESIGELAACVGKPWNTIKYRLQAEGVHTPPYRPETVSRRQRAMVREPSSA